MDPSLLALVVVIPLAAGVVALARAARTQGLIRAQTAEIWRDFARSRNLLYEHPDPRVFSSRGARITGLVRETAVELETFSKRNGDTSDPYTRVIAIAQTPFVLEARIYMQLPFAGLGKLLGAQDVETGDASFDEQFTLKADNQVSLVELLDEPVRRAISDAGELVYMQYRSGKVIVEWPTHERDPAPLEAMLELAVRIAERAPPDARGAQKTEADAPPPPRRPSRLRRRDENG